LATFQATVTHWPGAMVTLPAPLTVKEICGTSGVAVGAGVGLGGGIITARLPHGPSTRVTLPETQPCRPLRLTTHQTPSGLRPITSRDVPAKSEPMAG